MRLVIADTGPINYLLLIGHIDLLSALFPKVILPFAVLAELADPRTPPLVRNWILSAPPWVEILSANTDGSSELPEDLGPGETEALVLALNLGADLVLMDDRLAVSVALRLGINTTGTMGLLARAAKLGMIDLSEAFDRLKLTNFRYRQATMDQFLRDK